jgi:PD-(D/E)XK nuclease superfamily protein
VLTPDQKGAIAETAIAHLAVKLGVSVFAPIAEGERYDFIFARGPAFLRVQCKWAVKRDEVVVVTCRTCRRNGEGFVRTTYSASEVDLIAAYCADIERCFLLPPSVFEGHEILSLRLARPQNNQRRGIRWADDFDFAATLGSQIDGAIAQLGERVHGMHEVAGSSPAGSTSKAALRGLHLFA